MKIARYVMLVALVVLCGSRAHAQDSAISFLFGGDDSVGLEYRYDDLAARVSQFDQQVCRDHRGHTCTEWASEEQFLYEGALYLPIHRSDHAEGNGLFGYGSAGYADLQDGHDIVWGVGVQYRFKYIQAGVGYSSLFDEYDGVTGLVGYRAEW